jgi:2-polyprenyl-6-methoxyphenol hydroxylase-like FAD-dependent oxidoreductase
MEHFDALVVGGGPAGATAAALLAGAGWRVALVEKECFPRRKVCGEFISETTWPLLQALGIGEELRALAGPVVRRVGVFAGANEATACVAATPGGSGGRALGRELLDARLLRRAGELGVRVLQPWTLAHHDDGGEHYDCRLARVRGEGEHRCRARVLVAAHGCWQSGVLPTQDFRAPPRGGELFGFKAHFRGSRLPRDLMPLFAVPGGYGGMVHSDDGRLSLSCCLRREVLAQCRRPRPGAPAGVAVQAYLEAHCRGVASALSGTRRQGAWLAAGPLRTGLHSFGEGGIFAIGNAAAEAHPIIAEGISMAIQSASLLCERLLQPGASDSRAQLQATRAAYAAAWRSNFAQRLRLSAVLAHLFMARGPAQAATALAQRVPALLTAGSRWSGKARPLGG